MVSRYNVFNYACVWSNVVTPNTSLYAGILSSNATPHETKCNAGMYNMLIIVHAVASILLIVSLLVNVCIVNLIVRYVTGAVV